MQVDPEKRFAARDALNHLWIARSQAGYLLERSRAADRAIMDALEAYLYMPGVKRCCLLLVAWTLPASERSKVYDHFVALDQRNEGKIRQYDKNHEDDAELAYSDFLAALLPDHIGVNSEIMYT